jgi:hypothetical protein
MLELFSGIVMGLAFVAFGAMTGFAQPTEAEAGADPASLRWGRRPAVRRRMGLLFIVMGVLIVAVRIASVTMR